jgi:hypothetical protein
MRQRRAWAIETRLLDSALEPHTGDADPGSLARIAAAFTALASQPQIGLLHRYQARLHLMFQRALYNLILLRTASGPDSEDAVPPERQTNLVPKTDTGPAEYPAG